MATAGDLVDGALKELGVLGASDTAAGSESADGLTWLNRLIDILANHRLSVHTETRSTWSITANDGSYTVGSAGDVAITRPVGMAFIRAVGFIDTSTDPDTEFPLHLLTEDEYAAITLKAQTSTYPECAHYNPTYATGTLTLWPVPTSTTLTGVIYAATPISQFAALSTTVSLPPGYEELLVTNLALALAASFGVSPNPMLVKRAMDSMAAVKRANFRPHVMRFGADSRIGSSPYRSYDIKRD